MPLYERVVRPLFFRLEPETAHRLAMVGLRLAGRIPRGTRVLDVFFDYSDSRLEIDVLGLHFPNPVGLAAGYDKNSVAVRELAALGFGHLEVGTVTPLPQPGNPTPRVFRLPEDQAVINRMGFPNEGVESILPRLKRARRHQLQVPLGVNIGKGRDTPLDTAGEDYCRLFECVHPYADFVVVNVSSPNTLGLRELQARSTLRALLGELTELRRSLCPDIPLLVKIAPDLTWSEIDGVLEVVSSCGIGGIVATNTTVGRGGLVCRRSARLEKGGLSGVPLRQRSTEIIRYVHQQTAGALPIIGVGGVDSAQSALEKIQAGASLVQVYTGLVFRGPGLVRAINRGIAQKMAELGVTSLGELVGQTG
jgi:dihydroorotate dehydrogenase